MNYPEMCYVYVEVGAEIGVVKFGEKGYYQTEYSLHDFTNEELVKKLNKQLGVTDNEASAMKILSMNNSIDGNIEEWKKKFDEIVNKLNERNSHND